MATYGFEILLVVVMLVGLLTGAFGACQSTEGGTGTPGEGTQISSESPESSEGGGITDSNEQ